MSIKINENLSIPNNEIKWRFSRSSGPGGQNINKTESRVEIIFNIHNSKALNPYQKSILLQELTNKIINGSIYITIQEKRTQYENRRLAVQKLISLIQDTLNYKLKVRKMTKPTKASLRKRVESKKKKGEIKRNRQSRFEKDFK